MLPMVSAPAQPAVTTYEVQTGADFSDRANPYENGAPIKGAFSLRIYPGSIDVHQNDVIHYFGFGLPIFLDGPVREWEEENRAYIGDPYFDLVPDPDEGEGQFKFNPVFEDATGDCTDQANPCSVDFQSVFNPGFVEEGWVKITAPPNTTGYALFADGSYQRIQVVGNNDTASTQAELDARAEEMMDHDYETLASLYQRFVNKRSSHVNANGKRVWDAWAGIDEGPLAIDQMFPRRLRIKPGDRVMYHFKLDFNAHTVTLPQSYAFSLYESYDGTNFGPVCDPDTDSGNAPDVPATFPDEEGPPVCPDGSTFEDDVNPEEISARGDRVYRGGDDVEHSGVRLAEYLETQSTDLLRNEDPYTLRFPKPSSKKGYKAICYVHGPFMNNRIIVRR